MQGEDAPGKKIADSTILAYAKIFDSLEVSLLTKKDVMKMCCISPQRLSYLTSESHLLFPGMQVLSPKRNKEDQ
jgi:hypothetical protein